MKPVTFFKNAFIWNRKLHIYIGLFLLLFIWVFSISGLVLNHGEWKVTSFWDQRKESEIITPVNIPATPDSISMISDFMDQLNISGEVSNVKISSESIDLMVVIPGTVRNIHVDLKNKVSSQKIMVYNLWGKMRTLHTFNGVNKTDPEIKPNWIVTRIWKAAMDVIAIGLIILCISSWFMWYEVKKNYNKGMYVLIMGFASALFFVFLVRLL